MRFETNEPGVFADDPFDALPKRHFAAIYADPPWHFKTYSLDKKAKGQRHTSVHYDTMSAEQIRALPVAELAADDCVLFMWISWPSLTEALTLIEAWGFTYKTCAFSWIKADVSTIDMFSAPKTADMTLGYWTRANSEVCLLATRGKPKRKHADVRQGVIEPRREHSRKPDCIVDRIMRLVDGPYLELFARTTREGWSSWGNQTDKF